MNIFRVSLCLSPEGDRQFFNAWFSLNLQGATGTLSVQAVFDKLMTTCTQETFSDGSVAFMWGSQNWEPELPETQFLEKTVTLIAPEHHKFLVISETKEILVDSGEFSHPEFTLLLKQHGC